MDFDHIGEMIGPVQNPLSFFYWNINTLGELVKKTAWETKST
jgi:hypothetical protein